MLFHIFRFNFSVVTMGVHIKPRKVLKCELNVREDITQKLNLVSLLC